MLTDYTVEMNRLNESITKSLEKKNLPDTPDNRRNSLKGIRMYLRRKIKKNDQLKFRISLTIVDWLLDEIEVEINR